MTRVRTALVACVAVLAFGTVACGTSSTEVSDRAGAALTTTTPPTTTTPTTTTQAPCTMPPSPGALAPLPTQEEAAAADPFMHELSERESQKLVVAVDENTVGLSSRDPDTSELVGREITIAKRIAQQIYGGTPDEHVKFKTVTTQQKIDYVVERKVDLTISAISITCERAQKVEFSDRYLQAHHEYLVRDESQIKSAEDVAGARVCVTAGSTSIGILEKWNTHLRNEGKRAALPVLVDVRNDCHMQLQEGTVDAYLGHNTFIEGMVQEDRDGRLRSIPEGNASGSDYGIAIHLGNRYFTQYVNGVLAELRAEQVLPDLPTDPRDELVTRGRNRVRQLGGTLAVIALACVACSTPSDSSLRRSLAPLPRQVTTTTGPAVDPTPTTVPACDPTASFAPGDVTREQAVAQLQRRDRLVVGVDQGTVGWGFRNPVDGQLDGLEVKLLNRISLELFGDENRVEFTTLTTADRIPAVQRGDVDMVASLLSATCDRWNDVDFSTEYYEAHQSVLVKKNSDIHTLAELAGRTVCATRGSTSIARIAARVPDAVLYPVAARAECLVALQEGEVDAITSDDTILRGFEFQDLNIKRTRQLDLPDDPTMVEPYAIAVAREDGDLVRFVNKVLDEMRADGSLHDLYDQYLDADAPATVPDAKYR